MIQDILIGCGIIAAIVLSFFFLGYRSRPSDGRTTAPAPGPTPDLPDTRPNRPEGDEEI